jgi:RNA polymerase sigma-70 factor (ECF subfamily)
MGDPRVNPAATGQLAAVNDADTTCIGTRWDEPTGQLAPAGPSTKLDSVSRERPDDGQLMLRYGAGDAAAFEELYARHRGPLWRFVLRNLRDETLTADVFQEIWARVIAHRQRYAPTAKFTTWLYRIAHNCCVDHWRRTNRALRLEHPAGDDLIVSIADEQLPGPAEEAESADRGQALLAAVGRLPEEQRTAFLMYAEAGLGLAEIAAATGVGVETAKSRLRYASARLRAALDEGWLRGET